MTRAEAAAAAGLESRRGAAPAIGIDARKIRDFGIGRHLEGLLGALARRDDPERFVLFVHDADRDALPGALPHLLDPARFRLLAARAPLYSVRELFAFRGAAPRHGLALLHFPHYVRAFAPGCAVSVTMHDAIHLEEPPSFAARLYARTMMGWAARTAGILFTVSEAARGDLERLLPESRGKWRVAPNGVDPARFAPPAPAAAAAFRRSRGLPEEYVLAVASHRPHKNLEAAGRAFARAAAAGAWTGARLVVPARDAEAARRIAPLVAGVPHTIVLSPVGDDAMPLLYAAARIVLVPSRREGFGLPGLEAAACGAAVLASPIPAHRETLGGAAAYAASTSAEDLAAALASLWADAPRRAALSAAGPARAARFPWDASARAHLEAWRAALARRANAPGTPYDAPRDL